MLPDAPGGPKTVTSSGIARRQLGHVSENPEPEQAREAREEKAPQLTRSCARMSRGLCGAQPEEKLEYNAMPPCARGHWSNQTQKEETLGSGPGIRLFSRQCRTQPEKPVQHKIPRVAQGGDIGANVRMHKEEN
ncbi:hypothetical protein NDU88_006050 [Pleurodeles waltl]|uniref:Uncharacterized protein n=1 Tax=Pleurodeles waltl TaxID=8319 RepID=A0AAV7UNV6_PLEWA|nr:hypothetical protein NDU88_006050 [Pleurodeles waltl]